MALSRYENNGGVYLPCQSDLAETNNFSYSDGQEFEKFLYDVISNAHDKSLFSQELSKKALSWPTKCHLSPVRANLLRPLSQTLKSRVLELGAGCGALTRYLGENEAQVLALEASLNRAQITRLRCEGMRNVEVVCDRIEDFRWGSKFDVVTLIGVLQYARIYAQIEGEGERRMLASAAQHLDEDGVLVVAIQNKLGLKYLAGYPEPNLGGYYYGVENRYEKTSIVRFGLKELKDLLVDIGLGYQYVYYPFPDYHFPITVLGESAFCDGPKSLIGPLISLSQSRDKLRPDWRKPTFSMERAWNSVIDAGACDVLSNAFLVIAGKSAKSIESLHFHGGFAWHYSSDRYPAYATETSFVLSNNKKINVTRDYLAPAYERSDEIVHTPRSEPLYEGKLLWDDLVIIVNKPDWNCGLIVEWAKLWLAALGAKIQSGNDYALTVHGGLYDCTPTNCIRTDGGEFIFFDCEWEVTHNIPFKTLFIRAMYGSLINITSYAEPAAGTPLLLVDIIKRIADGCGLLVADADIDEFIEFDSRIQSLINSGKSNVGGYRSSESVRNNKIEIRSDFGDLEKKVSHLGEMVKSLEWQLHLSNVRNDAFVNSLSWRITKPIRLIKQYFLSRS